MSQLNTLCHETLGTTETSTVARYCWGGVLWKITPPCVPNRGSEKRQDARQYSRLFSPRGQNTQFGTRRLRVSTPCSGLMGAVTSKDPNFLRPIVMQRHDGTGVCVGVHACPAAGPVLRRCSLVAAVRGGEEPPIPWFWDQAAHVSPPVTRCPCPAQGGHPGAQGAMILAWPGADELMLHGQRRVIDVCFVDVSFCFFSYHGNFHIMTKHLLFLLEPQLLSCPAGYFGIQWLLF